MLLEPPSVASVVAADTLPVQFWHSTEVLSDEDFRIAMLIEFKRRRTERQLFE